MRVLSAERHTDGAQNANGGALGAAYPMNWAPESNGRYQAVGVSAGLGKLPGRSSYSTREAAY